MAAKSQKRLYQEIFGNQIVIDQISNDPSLPRAGKKDVEGSADLKMKDKTWKTWFLDNHKFKKGSYQRFQRFRTGWLLF